MNASVTEALVVSVAAGLFVGVAVMSLLTHRVTPVERISRYATPGARAGAPDGRSWIERALGDKQARKLVRSPLIERLRVEMDVAQLKFGVEQLLVLVALVTVLVGWLLASSTGSAIAALLALFVPVLANAVVKIAASRKRRAFGDQLPDNLTVIASAMRAGQTFVGALRAVLEDAPEPSRRELRRAVLDEQLGTPIAEALNRVTERMHSEDFQHVAIVAALQRETGGNTAEVVDLVAHTVRERIEIRRMVRSMTAQGRLSGGVLSMLPVGLLMLISLINPGYVHPLFHSTTGLIGLAIGIGLVVCGALVIRKIIDIKV